MRSNKIFAGPVSEALPQVNEAPAATATIFPGHIVTLTAGKFALAAVNTATQIHVAQDNYLIGGATDDAYLADETVIGLIPLDEQFFNCRFAAAAAVVKGDAIALAAGGLLQKLPATAGTYTVVGFADETVTLPAGAQDLIRVRFTQSRVVTVA